MAIYKQYECWRKAHINGKLHYPGEVVSHFPGLELRKSFRPFGTEIIIPDEIELTEEPQEQPQDEIKRAGAGRWKLPNGEIVLGKLADAKDAWEKVKQQKLGEG